MKKRIVNSIIVLLIVLTSVLGGLVYARLADRYRKNEYPRTYEKEITLAAQRYGVPEEAVFACIRTASGFDPLYEKDGKLGLYAMTEEKFAELAAAAGENPDPRLRYDPEVCIALCAFDLSRYCEKFGCTLPLFAAVAAGEDAAERVLSADGDADLSKLEPAAAAFAESAYAAYEKYVSLYAADPVTAETAQK